MTLIKSKGDLVIDGEGLSAGRQPADEKRKRRVGGGGGDGGAG